jgi:hypothetical protein
MIPDHIMSDPHIRRNWRVLLVDLDSTIPNLALMKVARYYMRLGIRVGFDIENPDEVYISVIFKENAHKVAEYLEKYLCAYFDIGGCGWDLDKKLHPDIENEKPYYKLYPECDTSYVFSTRGCSRNCSFCIVSRKEGSVHTHHDPWDMMDRFHDKMTFLDNNILADLDRFYEVSEWCIGQKIKVDFKSGFDIRYLTPEIVAQIKRMKHFKPIKFAYDDSSQYYTRKVIEEISMLRAGGINPRSCLFYVYIDSDEQLEDAVARCNILKNRGATAFTMVNRDVDQTEGLKKIRRYTRPWFFWSSNFPYTRDGTPLVLPDLLAGLDDLRLPNEVI